MNSENCLKMNEKKNGMDKELCERKRGGPRSTRKKIIYIFPLINIYVYESVSSRFSLAKKKTEKKNSLEE